MHHARRWNVTIFMVGLKKKRGHISKYLTKNGESQFVCWLLIIPATCECISGTDLHRQFYVLVNRRDIAGNTEEEEHCVFSLIPDSMSLTSVQGHMSTRKQNPHSSHEVLIRLG